MEILPGEYAKLYLFFLLHGQVLPLEFIKQILSVAGHNTFISEEKGIDICHKIRVGSSAMVMVVVVIPNKKISLDVFFQPHDNNFHLMVDNDKQSQPLSTLQRQVKRGYVPLL